MTYTYLSGDKNNNDRYSFWDPMFEDQILNSVVNAILPATNVMAFNAKASLKPMEDVTVTGVYGYYRLAKAMDAANGVLGIPTSTLYSATGFFAMDNNKSVGHAFDLITTYDYTEDVQLGLTFGYFNPGSAFNDALDNNATQLIGSMKVTF